MNYRKINNHIAEKLTLSETYTYLMLALKSDYKTGVSFVKQDILAELVGLSRQTVAEHLDKMDKEGLIKKDLLKGYINKHGSKKCQYTLLYDISPTHGTPEHWVWIDIDLLAKESISKELKAFLTKLKIRCFNYTNECHYSIRGLEDSEIGLKRSAIDKYIKQAEELDYINRKDGVTTLLDDKIFIIPNETEIAKWKGICPGAIDDDDFDNKGHQINGK